MTVRYFLDTNVLIYAATTRSREPVKAPRAAAIIEQGDFGISAQVLQEFYVNVVRKAKAGLSVREAMEWIERLAMQPCASIDASLVKNGIVNGQRHKISYWDGAIVAAAESLGAEILYTEDLNHGQVYGSVRAENPFLPA